MKLNVKPQFCGTVKIHHDERQDCFLLIFLDFSDVLWKISVTAFRWFLSYGTPAILNFIASQEEQRITWFRGQGLSPVLHNTHIPNPSFKSTTSTFARKAHACTHEHIYVYLFVAIHINARTMYKYNQTFSVSHLINLAESFWLTVPSKAIRGCLTDTKII